MTLLCTNKNLNPLQRRFGILFSTTLIATSLLFMWSDHGARNSLAAWNVVLFLLPAVPFLTMMFLIPYYLRQEKDEFVRTLVIRALLWGFGLPMVVDTIWGFLWKVAPPDPSMPMMNVDLFCIAALFALAIQVRRYR
jgi:quinol-cytochrome oxidoreductase complex cytochrome b subunit